MEPLLPPEDVVTEILIRVPANQLLKFQRVCGRWKDLISTKYFKDKHLVVSKKRNSSMVFIKFERGRNYEDANDQVIIIDNWSRRRGRNEPTFLVGVPNFKGDNLRFNEMHIRFSWDGLIVMFQHWQDFSYAIYNPITEETVTIDVSKSGHIFLVYSLFFNPWIKEYCFILVKARQCDEFEILNLGSQSCSRPLKGPRSSSSNSNSYPMFYTVGLIDTNIYWQLKYRKCEELILAFDIKTEEFNFLPHPYPCTGSFAGCDKVQMNMHIANIHGLLSSVQFDVRSDVNIIFNIWTLKDPVATPQAQPYWIKTHNTIIDFNFGKLTMIPQELEYSFTVIAFENGEILFRVPNERNSLFAYNLELHTLKKIWELENPLNEFAWYVPYTPSFASLKD